MIFVDAKRQVTAATRHHRPEVVRTVVNDARRKMRTEIVDTAQRGGRDGVEHAYGELVGKRRRLVVIDSDVVRASGRGGGVRQFDRGYKQQVPVGRVAEVTRSPGDVESVPMHRRR